jgi:hypothetical protein
MFLEKSVAQPFCHPALTLNDLLVVVASILNLISIALPDYIQALIRAQVTTDPKYMGQEGSKDGKYQPNKGGEQ